MHRYLEQLCSGAPRPLCGTVNLIPYDVVPGRGRRSESNAGHAVLIEVLGRRSEIRRGGMVPSVDR